MRTMVTENQDNEKPDKEKQNEFDRALNAALAKYASAEPRTGLEERVLANLHAHRARAPERAWWRWSLAGALVAVLVVALAFVWRLSSTSHPLVQNHSPSTKQDAQQSTQVVSKASRSGNGLRDRVTTRRATVHRPPKVVIADNPKLDQFPSPLPLSEQEKFLRSYVAEHPRQAALVARARSNALREDLKELQIVPSGGAAMDSEERNDDTQER